MPVAYDNNCPRRISAMKPVTAGEDGGKLATKNSSRWAVVHIGASMPELPAICESSHAWRRS